MPFCDIMNWNVAGAKLAQALQAEQVRPAVLLLQEVRVPASCAWLASRGYMTFFGEREKKESGVLVALRQDPMKKHSIGSERVEKHFLEVKIGGGNMVSRLAVIYVPPKGSGHYSEATMKRHTWSAPCTWMPLAGTSNGGRRRRSGVMSAETGRRTPMCHQASPGGDRARPDGGNQ